MANPEESENGQPPVQDTEKTPEPTKKDTMLTPDEANRVSSEIDLEGK
ncbi:MAG TPA: hypothetical protein VJB39_01235 [Patescibacteria group bacterium]|nr:hypothetical protein [Patescibacteria group bacterium]